MGDISIVGGWGGGFNIRGRGLAKLGPAGLAVQKPYDTLNEASYNHEVYASTEVQDRLLCLSSD